MTTAELSRRLAELGQPIQDSGITKIESGTRRVDVDDLVALAVALEVTPNALLLPGTDSPGSASRYMVTPVNMEEAPSTIWAWATGETPLGAQPFHLAEGPPDVECLNRELIFVAQNRPHHFEPATALLGNVLAEGRGADHVAGKSRADAAARLVNATALMLMAGFDTQQLRGIFDAGLAMTSSRISANITSGTGTRETRSQSAGSESATDQ